MEIKVSKSTVQAIQPLRVLFLHEANFQFISNSYHARGWTDVYTFTYDNAVVGYGGICGNEDRKERNCVFEFYIIPTYRNRAALFFSELLKITKATIIVCQSNDVLLIQMLYTFAKNIYTETILFKDHFVSSLTCENVLFKKRAEADIIFEHKAEPDGDYVLDINGEVVATGGFLTHYNIPYGDLYMEVAEQHRKKGYGSYLIQELKRLCYTNGFVPAARCDLSNAASKATLLKAGFTICGYKLRGEVK